MPNQMYSEFGTNCGKGLIDLSTDEIRAALVDTGVYTANLADNGDDAIGDIPEGAILSEATILNTTYVNRIFDGDSFADSFPDHGGGGTGEALVLYKHLVETIEILQVTSGAEGEGSFGVFGDKTASLRSGKKVVVVNSTGNNGSYSVKAGTVNYEGVGDVTTFTPNEAVPSATADGDIETSDPASSWLFLYLDTVTGLPLTFDGADDSITWDAAGIWEFAVSCP